MRNWIKLILIILIGLITGFVINNRLNILLRATGQILPEVQSIESIKYFHEEWRMSMRLCESSDNPVAINPNDLDGTPSYGLYQYKPDTFKGYVIKYNLFDWKNWDKADWENALMSRWHQEEVMTKMIPDLDVVWETEFPDCTKQNGRPLEVMV